MTIDPNSLGSLQGVQSNPPGTGRTSPRSVESLYGSRTDAPGSSEGVASGEDQVQLSDVSNHLQVLNTESPERLAQLEELKRIVDSGGYETDSREVSRRMIDELYG